MNDFEVSKKQISLNQAFLLIEEKLQNGGEVTFKPRGISMLPLLRQGKDSVTISPVTNALKKKDTIFYRRPNGQFVLHRIVGKNDDGYILCGDNQDVKEYGVKPEYIIGVLTAVKRGTRTIDCNSFLYSFYKNLILPVWKLNVKSRKSRVMTKLKKFIKKGL